MSSHRIQNNVGYRKIYPMSAGEDSTFCHYCGRKAGLELALHWDHVPALNVKIPREYMQLIKKTLVRACSECNIMASDHAHMEYIDRHLWLKHRYLETYKDLLLSGEHDPLAVGGNNLLAVVVNNSIVRYEQILDAIGFGLPDLSQITSPILDLKDDNGNYLRDVLNKHLSLPIILDSSDQTDDILPSLDHFFAVLSTDFAEHHERLNKISYDVMYQRYGYRVENLVMPKNPDVEYGLSWKDMKQLILYIEACKKRREPYFVEDLIELLDKDYEQDNYCTYKEFIDELANVMINSVRNPVTKIKYDFHEEQDFESWYENHKSLLDQLGIPALPCHVYRKEWTDIINDLDALLNMPNEDEQEID